MRNRLRLIGLAFLKVSLVSLFTLIAVEAFLQIAFLRLPPSLIYSMPQYPIRLGIVTDPVSGARHFPPNVTVERTMDGRTGDLYALSCLKQPDQTLFEPYTVHFSRDSHGFRLPQEPSSTVATVILGDSFAEAEAVQRPFWDGLSLGVYNMGLPDSGTLEQLALLRSYGLPLNPDIVILGYFGGNDLQNNRDTADLRAAGQTAESRALSGSPFNLLVLPHLIAALASPRGGCSYPIADRNGTPLAFYDSFFANAMLTSDVLRQTELWRTTAAALREMSAEVTAAGARFIVVYIPFKAQAHFDQLDEPTLDALRARITPGQFGYSAADSAPLTREAIDAQIVLLNELAGETGFTFIDLTSAFRAAAAQAESLYFYGDTHWNQAGHDLARQEIAGSL